MKNELGWWIKDRFGMFIHFGIYAVSEGKWKGEEVPGLVEWMQYKKQIPILEYKELAKGLSLENFDAKKYVMLAKAAGMEYVVFTAKHHDGFAMYDSKCSDYNVVKMCPSHRDIAKELAEEVRKNGLKMCFYYSQTLDWEDADAFGNIWDFLEEQKVYRRFLDGKCKTQLKELLTEYGDISLIWFDMPRGMTVEESYELKAWVKQFQPDCLVSGRVNMDQSIGDYGTMGDNEFPSGKLSGLWETPATLNNTWGYRKFDNNWKSPEELLRLLIELVSKGMNYLLNIGPMPDGTIPQESVDILTEMGKWVSTNQEAVYGTSATPYQFDFPWGRVSQKENHLYLYLFEHMERIKIPGIKNNVTGVFLLTEGGRKELVFEELESCHGKILSIQLPTSENHYYDVVCVELDGNPEVKQGLYELPDGQIHLYSHMAKLKKSEEIIKTSVEVEGIEEDVAAEKNNIWVDDEFSIDPNGNIINWFNPKDYASWDFELYESGTYEVLIQTRSVKYMPWVGGHLVSAQYEKIKLVERLLQGEKIQNAHSRYFDERLAKLGTVFVEEAGMKHLSIHLIECNEEERGGLLVTKVIMRKI